MKDLGDVADRVSFDSQVTRRRFLRGAGALGLSAALGPAVYSLVGCSESKTEKTVRMGIVLGNQVLWRYIAQRRESLLKPLGYEVTFVNYQDESQLVGDFLGGKLDVCATILNALPFLSTSASVKLFLPIAWMKAGFPIAVPESSVLRSIADLPGKRLAISDPNHASAIYWRSFILENYGFDLREKVELVTYGQMQVMNPGDLLASGKVDAAMVESHALSALLPGGSFRQIGDLRSEWTKVSKTERLLTYGGYVAKSDWVGANKKFVDDLIRINHEALKAYKANRSALIDPAVAYSGENAPTMTRESASYVADYLGYNDVPADRVFLSSADIEDCQKVFSLLARTGYLQSPPDASSLLYVSGKSSG